MASRRFRIFAGLFALGICAMLGTSRLDRKFTDSPESSVRALDRRIGSIHIHGVPADEAILQIQRCCDAKIVVRWNVARIPIIDPQQVIWLDFTNVTVRQLLQAVTDQLQSGPAVDFDVHNDAIETVMLESVVRNSRLRQFGQQRLMGYFCVDDGDV